MPDISEDSTRGTQGLTGVPVEAAKRLRILFLGLGVLALAFSPWLLAWTRFAGQDELASYVLLIPCISVFLIWQRRAEPFSVQRPAILPGILAAIGAVILAAVAWLTARRAAEGTQFDYLSFAMPAFLLAGLSLAFLTLGLGVVRQHLFAIAFLIFAAPLPSWVVNALEIFFQHTSAEVAAWMIRLVGIPMLRTGLVFQLPGITIQVAQECSGIRSSVVLFVLSILAGHVLLRRTSRKVALALFVIPLGILRNGFRILTIASLCVHIDARMIDSPIHHRGGPIFFALSLIPLFFYLLWLRRTERG